MGDDLFRNTGRYGPAAYKMCGHVNSPPGLACMLGVFLNFIYLFFYFFTREHILNSYGMKEETDMTGYS